MLPIGKTFLSRITYLSEKRQVVAEFSNSSEKISKRYSFFPRMHFPMEGISQGSLKEVLSLYDSRRFKVDFEENRAVIFAATFSDLKKINNLLSDSLGFSSNLIEPERQFLIDRGWSYFDSFTFSADEPQRVSSLDFPDVALGFLSDSLPMTMRDLISSNRQLAREIAGRVSMSRVLRIPLLSSEMHRAAPEVFLENVFFASKMPVPISPEKKQSIPLRVPHKTEIDFSAVTPLLLCRPFSNAGPETVNCACCRPASLNDFNVLADTIVKARFLREGAYFNSASSFWAEQFHVSGRDKDARSRRRAEYNYQFFPVGPFSRNETAEILLADAVELQGQGIAEILGVTGWSWFCSQKESAFSRETNALRETISSLESSLDKEHTSVVASNGLFFSQALEARLDYFYRKIFLETASSILCSVSGVLSDRSSGFFSPKIAVLLEVASFRILKGFEEICSSNGIARVSTGPSKAFVDSSSVTRILKDFSEAYKLNRPFVRLKTRF
ncbi:MAG: hypothetical protein AABW99_00345 [archaeon]